MLSKSQARAFFLIGTGTFALVFLGLTYDTFQKIPKQTNQAALTEDAIRGKHLFEKSNCMGCHTILGEGAYYAPELTKVFERRGETFIKAMLKDPQAMYPNDRKMTNYHFSDGEINDLTAFLKWIGTLDLNGFPAKPDLGGGTVNASMGGSATGRPQVFQQVCAACHSLNGQGGKVGPALDGVGDRLTVEFMDKWLRDPVAVKADSKMPKLPLSEENITELTAFLSSLKGAAQ